MQFFEKAQYEDAVVEFRRELRKRPGSVLEGVIVDGEGSVVVGHEVPITWTEMTRGGDGPAGGGLVGRPYNEVYLTTVQVQRALAPGARVEFRFSLLMSHHAGLSGELRVKVREPLSESFEPVGEAMPLANSPGDATSLEVRLSAVPRDDGSSTATVLLTDAFLNPVAEPASVSLRADSIEGLPASVALGAGAATRVEGLRVTGQTAARIEAVATDFGLEATSPPALGVDRSASDDGYYFGGLHFHTRLSVDGDRDPRQAYAYARDVLNLDVVSMADHAPSGPYWQEAQEVNAEFDDPGRFVTLPAWESSNSYGHANLYLRTADVEGGPWLWDPDCCPSEQAWDPDVVVVPHHTNQGTPMPSGQSRALFRKGQYWGSYDWSHWNERVRLVEMVQTRGAFEADAPDAYWGIRAAGSRASVRDALRIGWRLGFVAGTDNHCGHPTQSNHPPEAGSIYVGLTCFRASALTREAIWQAMDQRRTYATSGVPIIADFSVNGVPSGCEGALNGDGAIRFSAELHGTAPIERVEVISGGQSVWQSHPHEWDVEVSDVTLPAPAQGPPYYYLRLRQVDGHRAWLSPVWLVP